MRKESKILLGAAVVVTGGGLLWWLKRHAVSPPPYGRMKGRVYDSWAGGTGVGSAKVIMSFDGVIKKQELTAQDGSYVIQNITPGTYQTWAEKEGYTPQPVTDVIIEANVDLVKDFNIHSLVVGRCYGLVRANDPSHNYPVIPGAVLTFLDGNSWYPSKTIVTDQNGGYDLPLEPSVWTITCTASGFLPSEMYVANTMDGKTVEINIFLFFAA